MTDPSGDQSPVDSLRDSDEPELVEREDELSGSGAGLGIHQFDHFEMETPAGVGRRSGRVSLGILKTPISRRTQADCKQKNRQTQLGLS